MSANPVPAEPLRDRKRRQTRDRIVEAAFALFVARGFDEVTVDEIAQHAEIGRTTFFRYFGDKQEVVFSRERDFLHAIADPGRDATTEPPTDFPQAVAASRRLVVELCAEAARHPDHHSVYRRLVDGHPELGDRHARKIRDYAELLEIQLVSRGTPRPVAMLAAQVALGCYQTAWRLAGDDADALLREVTTAFDTLLNAVETDGSPGDRVTG